jgi:hypothetical protein
MAGRPETSPTLIGRPGPGEADPYYFTYIDRVPGDDVVAFLALQANEVSALLGAISEERSLHRYAPRKWSIRQAWNHVNDAERLFVFRAMWFARGFDTPLPSFDQSVAVEAARADKIPWSDHVEDFRCLRAATLSFVKGLPLEAWSRTGVASDKPFSVRALVFIVAGHVAHHAAILKERYL